MLKSSIKRIHQEHGAESLSPKRRANGQASEKSCRDDRIFEQFLRNLGWHRVQVDRVLRQGVIASYHLSIRCDYEGNAARDVFVNAILHPPAPSESARKTA